MERADPGLSVTLIDSAVSGERGRRLAFDDSYRRRGGTVDVRDDWEGLVGEREIS